MASKTNDLKRIFAASSLKIKLVSEQLIGDAIETTSASNSVEEASFDKDEFWKRLLQGSAVVSNEATKISMAFGGNDTGDDSLPDTNACTALCTSLETACAFLVSIFLQLPKQQGLTLRRRVQTAVREVLETAIAFVDNLQTLRNNRDCRRVQLTGCTWESCERIEKLPRDNKSAVRALISTNLELVNDAVNELQEAIEDEDEDSEKWRDSETHIAKTSRGLLKTAQSCLKKAGEAVLVKVETNDSPLSALDQVATVVDAISPATDDFVSALYPPVCTKTVLELAAVLAMCLTSLLASLGESGCFDDVEPPSWIDFLDNAVEHNLRKVENVIVNSDSG